MIYTIATQVAAIPPSYTPAGTGSLTVSYRGAQGAIAIRVVKNSVGIFAVNEKGSGPGIIANVSYQVRVPTDSAHPGDILVVWATGLGPVTGDETEPPTPVDLGAGVQVFVGFASRTNHGRPISAENRISEICFILQVPLKSAPQPKVNSIVPGPPQA